MFEIRRILCPIDLSETSKPAFEYAVVLAAQLGAELELLHVYQLPAYALPEGGLEILGVLKRSSKTGCNSSSMRLQSIPPSPRSRSQPCSARAFPMSRSSVRPSNVRRI